MAGSGCTSAPAVRATSTPTSTTGGRPARKASWRTRPGSRACSSCSAAIQAAEEAALLAVCHTFGVMCRWSGAARPVLRGADKGGKSVGLLENLLTPEALAHPWFSRFADELPDRRRLPILDHRLYDLIPGPQPLPAGALPIGYDNLIDLKSDGSFRLDLSYFNYCTGLTMTNERFNTLFGGPPRKPEVWLEQKQMDLAASVQAVIEEAVLRLARSLAKETGERNLCLAGGVALNCVANGKVLRDGSFESIWRFNRHRAMPAVRSARRWPSIICMRSARAPSSIRRTPWEAPISDLSSVRPRSTASSCGGCPL